MNHLDRILSEMQSGIIKPEKAVEMAMAVGYNIGYADRKEHPIDKGLFEEFERINRLNDSLKSQNEKLHNKNSYLQSQVFDLKVALKRLTEKF